MSLENSANLVDTDNDGMSDYWEILHGLSIDDPSDALLDLDEYEEQLNNEFNTFFPELIAMVEGMCGC